MTTLRVILLLLIPFLTDCRFVPEFTDLMSNLTVAVGENAVFSCHVMHLGGYRVGWIKADSKAIQAIHTHVITHNPRVSVLNNGDFLWQLKISNVQREDEGAYMCQINTDPMKHQIAGLRVVVPPNIEISESSTDVMVPEGGSIKLGCRAKGVPHPLVSWHREDGENIVLRGSGERLKYKEFTGETLRINKISRLDMGIYVCRATNGVPPDDYRRIMVNVNFHPVIHVPNQLIWASADDNCTMDCFVEASPRSINYWIKNEGELVISGDRYLVSEMRDSVFAVKMSLTIRNFRTSDVGKYRCVAKNSLGEVEGSIHVYETKLQAPPSDGSSSEYVDYEYEGEIGRSAEKEASSGANTTADPYQNEKNFLLGFPQFSSAVFVLAVAIIHFHIILLA